MPLIQLPSECQALPASRRLVVLVPDYQRLDLYATGKMVRRLASERKIPVMYLTIVHDYDSELPALHTLTRLAAITHDARVRADVMVEFGRSWLSAVRQICSDEDAVLCIDGQQVWSGLFQREQLSELLGRKLNLPIYHYLNGSGPHGPAGNKNGRK